MDFKWGLQGPQQVMGGAETYAPLGVTQGFYTVESLEKSQPQIFPSGSYAYQSSDGTLPPGSYAGIAMQPLQQEIPSAYASYGSSVAAEYGRAGMYADGGFGVDLALHSRVAPGSVAPPQYGLGDHYVPQEVYSSWLRNDTQNASSSSALFQQPSSLLSEPVREYSGYPLPYRGLSSNNSQVLNSCSTGTAKKKIASQFKRTPTFATTRKNSMRPLKLRVPTASGPGAPGWCSVCEIECNSKEVLEHHYLGRKHKRRLEKNEELLAAQMNPKEKNMQQPGSGSIDKSLKKENKASTQARSDNGLLKSRNQEPTGKLHLDKNLKAGEEAEAKASNSTFGKRKQKIAAEDIGTKRQKLLDAGTDVLAVKVCILCNTVCNSQIVFDAHLAGKKHAAQVKKLEEEANAVPQVNKLEDRTSSILQGNKLEEVANVTSQVIHNGKECTADGELDHKDGNVV